jgi:type I restriction enzyme S subunit
MPNWQTSTLGELIALEYGSALPSEARAGFGFPVFGSSGEVGRHTRSIVKGPGIIVGRKGSVGALTWVDEDFWPIDTTYYVTNSQSVDLRWLYWRMQLIDFKSLDSSTGVPGLNRNDAYRQAILIPAIAEQRRIAEILDTLDETIRKTEQLIAKLQHAKQGLLHDLLTRGIDDNGELRDPERHPEQFKDSVLGRIPKAWDVVQIGSETDIQHGFAFDGQYFTNKPIGPVLLVPGNFHRDGGLYFTDQNTKYFSGKYPQSTVLGRGDVLVVMTDLSPMTLILGRTVALEEEFPVLHNQRIGKFVFKKREDWDISFFSRLMNDDRIRKKVIAEATGTTVRHTSPGRIKDGFIVKPHFDEQNAISSRVMALDHQIRTEQNALAKFQSTKSGLMDDLLTGRVRVQDTLQAA